MSDWQITKYDPRFRDEQGCFLGDDWIGASQITEEFTAGVLTEYEYLRVEGLYADAVVVLWDANGRPTLQIQTLQGQTGFGLPPQSDALQDVGFEGWIPTNGEYIEEPARIRAIVRWCLRDLGWCQLESDEFYLHFGYDFYMYAGGASPAEKAVRVIHDSGLFVESRPSSHRAQYADSFTLQLNRIGEMAIEEEVPLATLDAAAIAELWPNVPSLAGYSTRPVEPGLAAIVSRHVELAFEFKKYEYTLQRDLDE